MSKNKYSAVKYIRLSNADDKKGESNSVGNQRKLIDEFIKQHPEIEEVSEKVDDGFSGILFDRPAFKEMMQDVQDGKVNCIICKDLSRFGREYIETGRYLRRILPAYGVRFIAINDNIDTLKDDADDLIVNVKSIINDAYCRDISLKTRSALNIKRINGDYIGSCPVYGYKRTSENRNQLVIDDYAASVVKDIFRMKIDGMSALKIAETLNNMGVLSPMEYKRDRNLPHPTGGFADTPDAKWSATAIFRILNDETYMGTLIQGKTSKLNYKIKSIISKPENEWNRINDAHDPIISKHDFELAKQIMKLDTRTAPGGDKVYLFSGVLICGCCGGRMTRKTNRYKDKEYHYYYCPTGKKRGCLDPVMLKENDLIECVLDSTKAHISNLASFERIIKDYNEQKIIQNLASKYQVQVEENQKQLKKTFDFRASLYENMISGIITKEDYKHHKAKYIADENRLQDAITKLEQKRDDVLSGKEERLRWMEHFHKFEGIVALDRRMVVNVIQNIRVISKTQLDITFKYQAEYEKAVALLQKEDVA
ncbi:MAG: recombinase family protein [Lachnospiraceae bacterium]